MSVGDGQAGGGTNKDGHQLSPPLLQPIKIKPSFACLHCDNPAKPKPRDGDAPRCYRGPRDALTIEIGAVDVGKKVEPSFPTLLACLRRYQHLPVSMHCHLGTKFALPVLSAFSLC